VLALLMCILNRMYLGQHYLTDCIGGFLIAFIIGFIVIKFFYYRSFGTRSSEPQRRI